jgi:hypothetical protein
MTDLFDWVDEGGAENMYVTPQSDEARYQEGLFRDEITEDFKAGKVGIENGWLVEYVSKHTCGTGPNGYYGAHEPGCGTVPLMDLWKGWLNRD